MKIQDTRQWCLSLLQSSHLGTSPCSPNCHQLPCSIFLNLTDNLKSLPSKMILVLGKARSCRAPNLGCVYVVVGDCRVTWVFWCFTKKLCMSTWFMSKCVYYDEAANHQLPIAKALWIIWIVSVKECSSLTQVLTQICCSTFSVILNATATQYTCSLNGPYWLIQWSHHYSCMCNSNHSPWLAGHIDIAKLFSLY